MKSLFDFDGDLAVYSCFQSKWWLKLWCSGLWNWWQLAAEINRTIQQMKVVWCSNGELIGGTRWQRRDQLSKDFWS